jgi:hypothetical protein
MNLRLFNYREPKLLSGDIATITSAYTAAILNDVAKTTGFTPISLSTKLINDRAQRHADKWIEETVIHLSLYSSAGIARPKLRTPRKLSRKEKNKVLKTKSFSGDVSGVIGESIFSSLLIEHFLLAETDFAHFRASVKSGISPDFGIYNSSTQLLDVANWGAPLPQFEFPIPAEVKTVTTIETSAIKGRLTKAVEQIRNYWLTEGFNGASIVCMALRNSDLRSYDLALIWGY